jgi:hypothetical protein
VVKRRGKPVTTSDLKVKAFHNKPRHGLVVECRACGWKMIGGGYQTLTKRGGLEQNARAEHAQIHNETLSQGKLRTITVEENGQFVQKIPPLKVTRYSHKVEAEHTFVQQTTRQTSTSTTYATVSGCTIASGSLDAGQTYLFYITAQVDTGISTSAEVRVRCASSATSNYANSEMATEIDTAATHHTYTWWNIRTIAASGEDFHLEMASSVAGTEVGVDQVCILAFRLTPDLVNDVDFKHIAATVPTTISSDNVDTNTGNASITLTPTVAGHRWLILSKARYATGIANTTSPQSRISRSGEAVNNDTIVQLEGEDAANSIMVLCGARVDTLGAQSNTYTEISKNMATPTIASITRTQSGIFMLDLDKFRNVAINNEDTPQEAPNSSTSPYAELVHSQSLTPDIAGNVWIMAFVTVDWGGASFFGKMRLQLDNVDQPATQTSDAYDFKQWTTEDRIPWAIHTVENLTAAASHTADIDGNIEGTGQVSPGSLTRLLVLMTFELAADAGITNVKNETEAITENVVRVLGTAGKQVKNETETITESVIPIVTSTSNLIQEENIEIWLSGGATNLDPAASIGGARSTAIGGEGGGSNVGDFLEAGFLPEGFITDEGGDVATAGFLTDGFLTDGFITIDVGGVGGKIVNKLFDDVTQSEASAGDIEYRCFYIVNSHPTLIARNFKIWIPVNTPAQDEIDIGLGSSGVNSVEQTIANENTAPSNVTFVVANSEATAINCGTIPASEHRAVWLRRRVPVGTGFFPGNTYSLQYSFESDHSTNASAQTFDANGIAYPQPLQEEGFLLSYSNEAFTFFENFREDGSMRCNFRDAVRNSAMIAGYYKVDINTAPDAEEVACQMNGAQHTNDAPPATPNNTYTDCMDIGITNMLGTTSRVRFEATHPTLTTGYLPTYEEQPIGNIRGVWRGYIGLKVNLDMNNDGILDSVALIGMVDIGGLDANENPVNNWKITFKRIFTEAEIEAAGIKGVFVPYVATIDEAEWIETTIRIDGQIHADWTNATVSLRPYRHVTCKEIQVTRI